jgi:hypothetical protein
MLPTRKRIKKKMIASLKCLGMLLGHKLSLSSALGELIMVIRMLDSRKYRLLIKVWNDIFSEMSEGASLSVSLSRYDSYHLVDEETVQRIAQAEMNGNLPFVLAYIDESDPDMWSVEPAHLESDSVIVRLVNKILTDAFHNNATQVAYNKLPEGEVIAESKSLAKDVGEIDRILGEIDVGSKTVPVYFKVAGEWNEYLKIPVTHKMATFYRLLFIAGLPYWAKAEVEGKTTIKMPEVSLNIKVHYDPEDQRMILHLS